MERVEISEPGADHGTQLGYYGGPLDGRYTRVDVLAESDLSTIADAAMLHGTPYQVMRYGVHTPELTLCWVLLMHSPIVERGKI